MSAHKPPVRMFGSAVFAVLVALCSGMLGAFVGNYGLMEADRTDRLVMAYSDYIGNLERVKQHFYGNRSRVLTSAGASEVDSYWSKTGLLRADLEGSNAKLRLLVEGDRQRIELVDKSKADVNRWLSDFDDCLSGAASKACGEGDGVYGVSKAWVADRVVEVTALSTKLIEAATS